MLGLLADLSPQSPFLAILTERLQRMLKTAGARQAELLQQIKEDVHQLLWLEGELVGTRFFLGELLEGIRIAAEAARRLRTPLGDLIDLSDNATTLRHLGEYLAEIGDDDDIDLTLQRMTELVEQNPGTHRGLPELLDLLDSLTNAH